MNTFSKLFSLVLLVSAFAAQAVDLNQAEKTALSAALKQVQGAPKTLIASLDDAAATVQLETVVDSLKAANVLDANATIADAAALQAAVAAKATPQQPAPKSFKTKAIEAATAAATKTKTVALAGAQSFSDVFVTGNKFKAAQVSAADWANNGAVARAGYYSRNLAAFVAPKAAVAGAAYVAYKLYKNRAADVESDEFDEEDAE